MAIVKNTNTMMADTGGVRGTGGAGASGAAGASGKATNTHTTATTTPKNTNTQTTTTPKATTTHTAASTTPKNTTTTTPTTTTPKGTQTTVTHADGTVSTAYIVNGRTVDANGNAYQFQNGDQVKTQGGTYTVNNGVGTKNETTPNTTAQTSGGGAGSGKASNTHATAASTPKNTTPTTQTTTPKATADHSTVSTIPKNENPNPPATTQTSPAATTTPTASTTPTATATPSTQGGSVINTAVDGLYNAVTDAYNKLQAEKDEILAAKSDIDRNAGGGGAKPATNGGAVSGNANTAGMAQAAGQGNASADQMAGATPTYVIRNGQQIPAFILNGKTVDANGNPFSFQTGDQVHTQGGDYVWNGTSADKVEVVDPNNPPATISKIPANAGQVPIYGPDGNQVGTGYVVNGVTYIMNPDGTGRRLTNPTDIPYIVRTQGGDYVMTKDGSYTLADYESKYGPVSNWTYQGGNYINNGGGAGTLPGSAEQAGTARAMTDYSNMTEGDLINYVMNAIETGDETALRDFMTWAEAESIARERMNPLYNQYIDQSMRNIDLKALQGGFYGQLPTEALRQQALAETEGNRTQAIIDYATQLLSADREGVLDEAKLNLDERQQRINTLMNLLESNRSMTQAEKDRELKKYIADQDAINAQGKLQNAADQFNQEMAYNREVQAQKNKQFYDDLELQKYIANLRY